MHSAGERRVLHTDDDLRQVVQLGQDSENAGELLRIRIERVGVALTESMQSVPRSSHKKRLSPKGAPKAGLGGLPPYTNRKDGRIVMHQSVQSIANNVNSNLAAWTTLRPGTDAWLNWQRNVKKTLMDTPELQQNAKYIVPPRALKGDHAYILIPSAGSFYYFPFVSGGRRYALLGRPRCVNGTAEQQVPPELLTILKKLAPEVCTPANELAANQRQQDKDKDRAEYMAKVSSAAAGQAQSKEEIIAHRKELMAKEQARQEKDWVQQVQAMRSHNTFVTLLPGGSMIAAMDVTLLVVDDAQCLLASRGRIDNPSERDFKSHVDIRTLLADITVVSAFDVLATMQLQADSERAYARQQALILEIEEENELKCTLKTTKQAKNRKKKKRKQQKSTRTDTGSPAQAALPTVLADATGLAAPTAVLVESSDRDNDDDHSHAASLKVPSGSLSESTDGTDDGLAQELQQAIAIADEEELFASSGASDGWTVVAPPRAKPVSSKLQKKTKQQQGRRAKETSAAAAKATIPGAEKIGAEHMTKKNSSRHDHSEPATPERDTVPSNSAADSPPAQKPSSPMVAENNKEVSIGEMEWPQLASLNDSVGRDSVQHTVPLCKKTVEPQLDSKSAKVAAQQIESMMQGLANEDAAMPETSPQEPPVQATASGGDGTDKEHAAVENTQTGGTQPLSHHDLSSHGIAQQSLNLDAPAYVNIGAAGLATYPNQFSEGSFLAPSAPEAPIGFDPATRPPEGMQTFTVAFTVQGSGTICVNAPSGQDAIEQLQYNTSLEGGLAGLLSYAKCATMFQVIE